MSTSKKVLFIACLSITGLSNANAATIVDMQSLISSSSNLNKQALSGYLGSGTKYQSTKEITLPNGVKKTRLQQYFQGVPIWGYSIAVSQNALGSYNNPIGLAVSDITTTPNFVKPTISAKRALKIAKSHWGSISSSDTNITSTTNEKANLWIYLDEKNQEHLVYLTDYLINDNGVSRPNAIIDAHSGKILKQWQGLTTQELGTGPGGNEKIGEYQYGIDRPYLDITKVEDSCYLRSGNVVTNDASIDDSPNSEVHIQSKAQPEGVKFTCPEHSEDKVNGAYSPLNDAHYYGQVIINMYHDWLNIKPLPFQLVMNVHNNVSPGPANAWWNGKSMNFGDGDDNRFYPLVALDVAAHEISHGFTEKNSGLVYSEQSGGMNEAFSDMAGEAAKFYQKGYNNFLVGEDITKNYGALRYMKNQSLDGCSVTTKQEYDAYDHRIKPQCSGFFDFGKLNVHFVSGVYNRAFYLLATSPNWNTKKAFDVFTIANILYWQKNATFESGACGVINAAQDLNMNGDDVKAVFSQVGVICKKRKA
ncbi:MAG: M4 family metallopeptidase [Parashewanella sp.]